MIKKYIIFILLFISIATRLFYLVNNMKSVTHDEADIYMMGRIVAQTGKDIYNNTLFATTGYLTAKPSVPIYISTLGSLIFPKGVPLYSRLPFALLNSFTPVLLYCIVFVLTRNVLFSFFTFLVMNFSPWFGPLSATGYEGFIALFFFLLSLYTLVSRRFTIYSFLLSMLLLFFMFNSYMGLRIIFPVLVFCLFLYARYTNRKHFLLKVILQTIGITIVVSGLFFGITYILPDRSLMTKEAGTNILFLNNEKISNQLWYANLTSQGPIWAKKIVVNRFFIPLWDTLVNYSESFNLQSLFVFGENSPYGFAGLAGMFYFVDIGIFIFGLSVMSKFPFKKIIPLFVLFIIAGIPTAIVTNTASITLRGILLIIPYTLVIAYGLYYLTKRHIQVIYFYFFFLIANMILFQIVYSTRIKVLISGQYHLNEYNLIRSLPKLKESYPGLDRVYLDEPKPTMLLTTYYKKDTTLKDISDLRSDNYVIDDVLFLSGCPHNPPLPYRYYIVREQICRSTIATMPVTSKKILFPVENFNNDYLLISQAAK